MQHEELPVPESGPAAEAPAEQPEPQNEHSEQHPRRAARPIPERSPEEIERLIAKIDSPRSQRVIVGLSKYWARREGRNIAPLIEDLAQQTRLNAIKSIRTWSGEEETWEPWLAKIVRNVFYAYLRRKKTDSVLMDADAPTDARTIANSIDEHPNPEEALLEELRAREQKKILEKAIAALPPLYRSVMELVRKGSSYRAAAEQLGISEDAVRARVYRAKGMIKKNIKRSELLR